VRSRLFLLFFIASICGTAADVKEGFRALSEFDYFKARSIFYSAIKKKPDAAACYGLALIASRQDNPFNNTDTAVKYVYRGYNAINAL
jgi:hypothetical protein